MIIDAHLHCPFGKMDVDELKRECEKILYEFGRSGIDKSCVMHCGGYGTFYHDAAAQLELAECLVKIIEMFPDKFYALLTLNGMLPANILIGALDKYIVKGPLTGVKFTIQMNARDKRLEEVARFIEKHDIPVLWHCWYKTTHKYPLESDPRDVSYFARKFPRIRILMAHLTGCGRRGVQDIKDCPNVLIDTSGSQPYDGYLDYALKALGPDRVLYGSDYPCRDIPTQLGRVYASELSPEVREKVLCVNALKFYTKKGN
ncbi:MAG: hypothetical protein A2020_02580 [Lentisphaerae bacterium GWF2_45_14]|nr:MAG: hypothetical protein A2020_02580 [Lentisphaerae bacterium GWF2_45_14]